ncbi:MAG: sugar ABC transporter permease [Rhodospirillales bacterium]|nr:sugar ABC transporter permease [Rhodospirillales bacterium]
MIRGERKEAIAGWMLILPALLLLVAFTHYPTVAVLIRSLFGQGLHGKAPPFLGLGNYRAMVADPVFWQALRNNALYAAAVIPLSMALAIIMALAVDAATGARIAGRVFLRVAYFTPTVLPMIAIANIWLFFFTPGYGLIDRLLSPFGLGNWNWLGSTATALPAMIAVAIWREASFYMIFYLAALQAIPPTLREAAMLEGSSRLNFFRRVLWPLLTPTSLFVFVNVVIDSFRLIDQIVVMTHGGPDNATTILLYYIYEVGFQYWDAGYASALTSVLLAGLAIVALVQFGLLSRRVHYR